MAGDNPADEIIRKAIAAKPSHDPKNLQSYSFNSYNKTVYTALGLHDDSATDKRLEKKLRYGHLLLMESYSEVRSLRPGYSKETVLKTKVSGWDDPQLAMLSSSFQPFGFHDNIITLFEMPFINPLADGALKRYEYYLTDTLFNTYDTTYVLAFEPVRRIEYKTLKGILHINTNG